jgi:SH3 domain-containing YSC84-like protein 1
MKHELFTYIVGLLLLVAASAPLRAQVMVTQNPTEVTVIDATNAFSQAMMMQDNQIPRNILANAQAIAIVPGLVRGAFVVGVQHGRGVLITRDAAGAWQAPRMIQMTGGSIGYQIGLQATDLVLVFRTPQSVANLLAGTVKVGVDASAAAGPVGRQASAGTDLRLTAEIYSYSRARGAFVGVSIDGSSISLDPQAEAIYYQPPGNFPASAMQLLQVVASYAAAQPVMAVAAAPAPAASGWVAAGQRSGEVEVARQQLDTASRKLTSNLDENWKRYLAMPPEVYVPNQTPNPQTIQATLARYEEVSRKPEYAALQTRPEFQQTVQSLRRLNEVRTASNTSAQLPPPPR